MFCIHCGAKLSANSRFCAECGARLADPSSPPPIPATAEKTAALPAPNPVTPVPPPTLPLDPPPSTVQAIPGRKRTGLIFGALAGLGLLLIGACVGLVFVTINFAENQRAAATAPAIVATAAVPVATAVAPAVLGELLLSDDFTDPARSVFGEEETEISRFAFVDDSYLIEVRAAEYLVWWLTDEQYSDIVIETNLFFPPGTQNAAAALVFHYQDNDNFYLFSVSDDGYYTLEIKRAGAWESLINWTESPAIDAVRNVMRVETQGERIALYTNDDLLEVTTDATFTTGDIGLAVVSFAETPAMVRFETLTIAQNR